MVKLPTPADQPGREMGERGSNRALRPQNHRQWGTRYGRSREEMRRRAEPTTLSELEALTARAVEQMERYNPKSENNFSKVMDLLRLQHNLNFMIICDKCKGLHNNYCDEIIAPER